ncbi:MAG: alpha-hydroxy-acid oxidizing protein [Solirubrobacterales bacterium]|nr:alpha-hydroxy-acid oxidizing protein [Solirubrobacterales bacterium]
MKQDGFFDLLVRQVRGDLADLPSALRRRVSDEGRVERCGNIAELRALARRRIPGVVFDYVDGGAWDELTAARNQADLRRLAVLPHALTGASDIDLSTSLLGQPVTVPLMGAPTGMTGIVHHDGEVALARAVHGAGGLHVLSSVGSRTVEEVAGASPGPMWLQLYVSRDRGYVRELLGRARRAGYLALVVTVDVQRAGARERDRRNRFSLPPRVSARALAQGVVRPRWSMDFIRRPRFLSEGARQARAVDSGAGQPSLTSIINSQFDPGLTWSDIGWVQEQWEGPVVLKGVLRAEDAQQAARLGVRGVIVSNHGGRQLDHAPSSISALPAVADAVGSEIEVYMDGGIRRGVDILKAVALGARACLSGRALVYGLGAGGEAGAIRAVNLLIEELRLAMTLAGCRSLSELDPSWVTEVPQDERSEAWNS